MMRHQENEDKITKIMSDPDKVCKIIQAGISADLLKHKQAGNPVCGWKNGKVYWIKPENIPVNKE